MRWFICSGLFRRCFCLELRSSKQHAPRFSLVLEPTRETAERADCTQEHLEPLAGADTGVGCPAAGRWLAEEALTMMDGAAPSSH